MTIIKRAAIVLQEIDAALALAEKATPGPWKWDNYMGITVEGQQVNQLLELGNMARRNRDGRFIAASRTGWPTALRCLKTAIEGHLFILENYSLRLGAGVEANIIATLTTLCDQWDSNKK